VYIMKRVIEVKELTLPEVKALLEKRGEDAELNRVQRITLDYVSRFCKIDLESALKLKDELTKKFGLSLFATIQIINIMPESIEELRTLLTQEGKVFTTEELESILATLDKYREKEESE